jgi:hypothetical protein
MGWRLEEIVARRTLSPLLFEKIYSANYSPSGGAVSEAD